MFEINGNVIKGDKKGTELGFPTANIEVKDGLEKGVFAGFIEYEGRQYMSAFFVGERKGVLEAHLLDYSGDLYGKNLIAKVVKKIRDILPYESDEKMKEIIEKDIKNTKKICLQG